MTSVLNVDTIADKAGTGPVGLTKQSAAKAWVNFDTAPSTPAIQGSFNISSLTDGATEVAFNLTSAMSDAFYAPVGSGGGPTITNPANRNLAMNCISTTQVDTEMYTVANAQATGYNHGSVLGDLA
jgi:hypothetical protein